MSGTVLGIIALLAALASAAAGTASGVKEAEAEDTQKRFLKKKKRAEELEKQKQEKFQRRQALKRAVGDTGVEYYRPGPGLPEEPLPPSYATENIVGGIGSGIGQLAGIGQSYDWGS